MWWIKPQSTARGSNDTTTLDNDRGKQVSLFPINCLLCCSLWLSAITPLSIYPNVALGLGYLILSLLIVLAFCPCASLSSSFQDWGSIHFEITPIQNADLLQNSNIRCYEKAVLFSLLTKKTKKTKNRKWKLYQKQIAAVRQSPLISNYGNFHVFISIVRLHGALCSKWVTGPWNPSKTLFITSKIHGCQSEDEVAFLN